MSKRQKINPSWTRLGQDAWTQIVRFLDIEDHFVFETTSKFCQKVAQQPHSWCTTLELESHGLMLTQHWKRFCHAPIQKMNLCYIDLPENDNIEWTTLLSSLTALTDLNIDLSSVQLSVDQWNQCLKKWTKLTTINCRFIFVGRDQHYIDQCFEKFEALQTSDPFDSDGYSNTGS